MVAEIIGVGAGLLSGDIVNQNARFLSRELSPLGIEIARQSTVGDNKLELQRRLAQALERSDLVILLGGIGPTADDITKQTIVAGLGSSLELHEESLAQIQEFYRKQGREMPPEAMQMAMMPKGAAVFRNRRGAAPGCALSAGSQCMLLLPENPGELSSMLLNSVYPYLVKFVGGAAFCTLHLNGLSADEAARKLGELLHSKNPVIALYPVGRDQLALRITARGAGSGDYAWAQAEKLCAQARGEITRRFGAAVSGAAAPKAGAVQAAASSGAKQAPVKQKWYQKLLPWKGDDRREVVRKSVLLLAMVVLAGSLTYIGAFYWGAQANRNLVAGMESLFQQGASDLPEGYPKDYLAKFAPWWEINPDVAGRIEIEGTPLKYAIVQGKDNDYYLRRTFYKKEDKHGVPFVDFRVDLKKESTNTVIYGHNMTDGQIFGELINYKKLDYYRQHPVIKFDSVYREGTYKIAAVILTRADDPNFMYHDFIEPKNNQEMEQFIFKMQQRTLINTTVDVRPGDKLITLSTCDYSFRDPETNQRIARFVVIGRKVRAGESAEVDTANAQLNPNPLLPGDYYDYTSMLASSSSSESSSGSSSESLPESESSSSPSDSSEEEWSSSESSEPSSSESSSESSESQSSESSEPPPSSSESSEEEPSSSSSEEEPPPEDSSSGGGGPIDMDDLVYIDGEEYEAYDAVARIVMNETGGTFETESTKAQAVAVYSRLVAQGGDVSGFGMRAPNSAVKKAVKSVWGEAVHYRGKPIDVYFYSISAGATNTAREVWGGSIACHNENVDSHWDEDEPGYKVRKTMTRDDVIDRVYDKLGVDLSDVPDDEWFTVDSYTGGGYNDRMTVGGVKRTTGRVMRESVLGLRSAAFEWEFSGNKVIFTTYGYGHGCGMSQHGANGMARDGYDYIEILEHYYPGCSVE